MHSAGRSACGAPRRCDAESGLSAGPERPPPGSASRAAGRSRAARPVGRAASALLATPVRRRQGGAVRAPALAATARRRRRGAARVRGRARGRGQRPSRRVHPIAPLLAPRPNTARPRTRRVGRHHLLHGGPERLETRTAAPLATPPVHHRAATHHRRVAAACQATAATAALPGLRAASPGYHSRPAVSGTEGWRCTRPRLRTVRTGAARRRPARRGSGPGTASSPLMTSSMTSASAQKTARPLRCRQALARRPPAGKWRAAARTHLQAAGPPSGSLLAEDHWPGVVRVRRRADGDSRAQTGARLVWLRQ